MAMKENSRVKVTQSGKATTLYKAVRALDGVFNEAAAQMFGAKTAAVIRGKCLGCKCEVTFSRDTSADTRRLAREVLEHAPDPVAGLAKVALSADAYRVVCEVCDFAQKICLHCDSLARSTAAECAGCGRALG